MYPLALTVPLIMLLFLLRPPFVLALILLALTGLESCYSLELDRRLRDAIPVDLRPRAFALNSTGLMVSQGLGFVAAGAVGQFAPPAIVIGIGGAIGLVGVAVLWLRSRAPDPSWCEPTVMAELSR